MIRIAIFETAFRYPLRSRASVRRIGLRRASLLGMNTYIFSPCDESKLEKPSLSQNDVNFRTYAVEYSGNR